ncbi:MAG: hypothetical protein K2G36_10225 [Ruminococcus sp.]|nr:hypothetical protein [Ruminococcus sp.]
MYKFLFELVTSPLSLPIEWYYEYLILLVINEIAYHIAYAKVGNMYHSGLINGRKAGSFFHWLIRLILFFGMWFITHSAIQGYYFATENPEIILMIAGSITGVAIICVLAVSTIRFIKKHNRNRNA